jgi:selenide, water dikinase
VITPGLVPLLDGVEDLLDAGHVPGGTRRNLEQAATYLAGPVPERTGLLLADAQTSGGLLLSLPPDAADVAVERLVAAGHPAAAIGEVTDGPAGTIEVTP